MVLHDKNSNEPVVISLNELISVHDRGGIYTEITIGVRNVCETKVAVSETVPEVWTKIQEDSAK